MKRGGVRGINNRIVGVGSDVGPHFVCARRPRATCSPCVPTRPVRHMPHRDGRMPARSCAGRIVVIATPEIIFLPVMQVTSRSNLGAYLKLATRSSSPTGADPPFPGSVPWDGREPFSFIAVIFSSQRRSSFARREKACGFDNCPVCRGVRCADSFQAPVPAPLPSGERKGHTARSAISLCD